MGTETCLELCENDFWGIRLQYHCTNPGMRDGNPQIQPKYAKMPDKHWQDLTGFMFHPNFLGIVGVNKCQIIIRAPSKKWANLNFKLLILLSSLTSPLKHHPHLNIKHISIPFSWFSTPKRHHWRWASSCWVQTDWSYHQGSLIPRRRDFFPTTKIGRNQPTGILKEASAIWGASYGR